MKRSDCQKARSVTHFSRFSKEPKSEKMLPLIV